MQYQNLHLLGKYLQRHHKPHDNLGDRLRGYQRRFLQQVVMGRECLKYRVLYLYSYSIKAHNQRVMQAGLRCQPYQDLCLQKHLVLIHQ